MEEEKKDTKGMNMTLSNLAWMKDAPLCTCGSEEAVLYLCMQKNCHEKGNELYCSICLENFVHKERPAKKIEASVNIFMAAWVNLKERVDTHAHHAATSFRPLEKVVGYLESCFKP
jgi:hypothetical protein